LRAARVLAVDSSSGPGVFRWVPIPASTSRDGPPTVCFAQTAPVAPPFFVDDPFPGFRPVVLLMESIHHRKRHAHTRWWRHAPGA